MCLLSLDLDLLLYVIEELLLQRLLRGVLNIGRCYLAFIVAVPIRVIARLNNDLDLVKLIDQDLLGLVLFDLTQVLKLVLLLLIQALFVIPDVIVCDFFVLVGGKGDTPNSIELEFFDVSKVGVRGVWVGFSISCTCDEISHLLIGIIIELSWRRLAS
jgi:hypothetical protein